MKSKLAAALLSSLLSLAAAASAQTVPYTIDATQPAPAAETGFLRMGGVSASGGSLQANSRSLTLNGKPWLPIAGEFHFSRYPEAYWNEELAKMKADGVTVVDTYIFWIHHEEVEDQFDWSGQRDLRHFVQLCWQNGLYVYLRIGPWAHGEARNGGFPDWLVERKIPLRRNDPAYLNYVGRFYTQIGQQVHGMLWPDGGPIIGVQLENEYGESNPDGPADHLTILKRLAIDAGINPPLFSITGWPSRPFAPREFIPVFGGYADNFWDGKTTEEEPNWVYYFDTKRAVGDMGAIAAPSSSDSPTAKPDLRHYPFVTAEMGGGMETSYQRRPLMQPDDVAAETLVGLGSGVNLFGYYMFHGGANPHGLLTTMQESLNTLYPNDLPHISYDFQAPLGQYGQERESFRKIKSLHLFAQAFGSDLAQMAPYAPAQRPKDAADLGSARMMLRANGNRGFLFVNNYVRHSAMPARAGFQVQVTLPAGPVRLPRTPITLPANSYFVWPLNLDVGAGTLQFSTAQLLSRLDSAGQPTFFFFAIPGLRTEFQFDATTVASVKATSGAVSHPSGSILIKDSIPGKNTVLTLTGTNGSKATIILLTQAQAEQFWRVPLNGADTAMLSPADVFADAAGIHLRSLNPASLTASRFTGTPQALWSERTFPVQPRKIDLTWTKTRQAADRPALRISERIKGKVQAPEDSAYSSAAQWTLKLPAQPMTGLSDIFLRIHYAGDTARLYAAGRLLDDDFYNGRVWEIGLKRFLPQAFGEPIELDVLPLTGTAPIYLDQAAWQSISKSGQTAAVSTIEALPEYEAILPPTDTR